VFDSIFEGQETEAIDKDFADQIARPVT